MESKFLSYFIEFMIHDWFASIPITICSVLTVAVIVERYMYYQQNRRDVTQFIHQLQRDLESNNLQRAQQSCNRLGGVVGEVAEEGVRLMADQKEDFSKAFDITVGLVTRKLEKHLAVLGTIGATSPFIGLFGTVVGVVFTLDQLGSAGGGTPVVVTGVAKALIATGYGLIVAILAVIFNNTYTNIVKRFNDDFLLLKLLFLSFVGSESSTH
ncbi:MAG: MotA/TolQ/ExbB proton channel family protein [Candidatus Melainabacteria bacterium]|jgi:biopolymer transport protein ExbB|nr:MotA/TolQ/ExbB proton channel family protein [Candidatus Melainabacteria bacterium]MBX9673329.1 MotA/TolQ/ExbB proton channel family protein [Candidatus Obscuribacterales bacterium]